VRGAAPVCRLVVKFRSLSGDVLQADEPLSRWDLLSTNELGSARTKTSTMPLYVSLSLWLGVAGCV
jgi:hypothetical protein